MLSSLRLATSPDIVRRALWYAVVVGAVLIAINHGDALARGELGSARLIKMTLHGLYGPITVKGKKYDPSLGVPPMTPFPRCINLVELFLEYNAVIEILLYQDLPQGED